MKVFDIINEAPSNEAVGFINKILKGVAWSLGNSARNQAARQLAEAWSAKMLEAGNIRVGMPVNIIKDPVLAADREIMNAAYKEAVKAFRQAQRAGLIKAIKEGAKVRAAKLIKGFNFMARWGSLAASAWSLWGVWKDYEATYQIAQKALQEILEDESADEASKEKALADFNQTVGSARMIYGTKVIAAITIMGSVGLGQGLVGLTAKGVDKFKNWLGKAAGLKGNAAAERLATMLNRLGDIGVAVVVWELVRNQKFHNLLDDIVWNSTILQTINVNIIQPDAPFDSWDEIEALIAKVRGIEASLGSGSLEAGANKPPAQSSAPTQNTTPASDTPGSSGVDWSNVKR